MDATLIIPNGYMTNDGYMNTKVGAGKKAKEVISFSVRDLAMMGIIDIADIDIGFDIEYVFTASLTHMPF